MSASTSETPVLGNRAKIKGSSGWAQFDLKQRRKQQGLDSEIGSEDYPVLSGPNPVQSLLNRKGTLLEKTFSSAIVASMNFPSLMANNDKDMKKQGPEPDSSWGSDQNVRTDTITESYHKLSDLHPWADESLIQDVLAGVNNNFNTALSLLEAMVISENKNTKNKKVDSVYADNDDTPFDFEGVSFEERQDMSFLTNYYLAESNVESKEQASLRVLLDTVKSLPIEPEWEEDDVYLIHRKDAIGMIRSASHHSKAANDAFLSGNHLSANRFSLKAREEWIAAKKLNAKAAKEILAVRNSDNDDWTLDLHGLHASEAVQALRERLQKVESLVSSNCSAPMNGKEYMNHVNLGRQNPLSRQRTMLLHVITGKGNHSRGEAALPSAIRNFLSDNGYHFDGSRPGVIMIRPKFRQH